MNILICNVGSTSLKYQLFDMEHETVLAKGLCERIGIDGKLTHKTNDKVIDKKPIDMPTHAQAVQVLISTLTDKEYGVISDMSEISAVGHRVAHGGEKFKESSKITESVIAYLETIVPISARLICNKAGYKFKNHLIQPLISGLARQTEEKI